jgi:succinate dehydrogenase/fumarate reductase flavoprotein subunit
MSDQHDDNKDLKGTDEAPLKPNDTNGLSRRDFIKTGAAAGLGAALLGTSRAVAQQGPDDIDWDYEADIVVVGAGCMGLPAAIRARDAGASVLVVDKNFDVGGIMLHSGGYTSLGGGDAIQERDRRGETDDMVTVEPQVPEEALDDNPDLLFADMTDWSVVDVTANPYYRYNQRDQHKAWADNAAPTRQFLLDNYVRYQRITGTHQGGGVSRARAATSILKLGPRTDIPAGTVSLADAGGPEARSTHFAPAGLRARESSAGPDVVGAGACLARCLEYSAREKGIRFMLNRGMDELVREEQFSGRVLGIKTSYTPRYNPDTGARLESFWGDGNIDEIRDTVYIRARRAVIVATGGHSGNPTFRSMFYPAMAEPAYNTSAWALIGPGRARDGTGIIAGMKVGANLAGMQQNYNHVSTWHIQDLLGTPDAYTDMTPGHPTFPFRGSTGIPIGSSGFEQLIVVNQVGKRFYAEDQMPGRTASVEWPAGPREGTPNPWNEHVVGDWRNNRPEWVRETYNYISAVDAALAINEGSKPPDYLPGPIWAIFDAASVERGGWNLDYPYTADNLHFFEADTIEELEDRIMAHPHSRVRMTNLRETVDRWNSFVDNGEDGDFEREAGMHKIDTPPFYAATVKIVWHDSYGGLRVNGKMQVIDLEGKVIPGLYSGGEASGGGTQHGLGRCLVHGYIAGHEAANEASFVRGRRAAAAIT